MSGPTRIEDAKPALPCDVAMGCIMHAMTEAMDGSAPARSSRSPRSPLIVRAYGLSGREREVAQLTLLGRSTAEIAERLFLSPFTVQDHLKVIFEKVGVHSRKELVARIFVEQYAPQFGAEAGAQFATSLPG